MTSCGMVLLLFLLCLCGSGVPVLKYSFRPMAQLAVGITQDQVNLRSARPRLFRVTNSVVQHIAQMDLATYDLHLNFDIIETTCPKGFERYLDRCDIRRNKKVMGAFCSSVVRVGDPFSQLQSMDCRPADISSSSSESSSEEVIALNRVQPVQYTPGVTVCHGAISCAPYLL